MIPLFSCAEIYYMSWTCTYSLVQFVTELVHHFLSCCMIQVLLHVVRMLYLLVVDHKPFITAGLLELLGLFVWGLYLVAETQQFRNTKISHSHLSMSLVVLVVLSMQTLQLVI